jgi:DNA-binding PadR family transcriptional regulator
MMRNHMDPKPNPKEVMRAIRDLERKGLIESRLDQNGEIRWYITGKPYYEDALDDADDSEELLN